MSQPLDLVNAMLPENILHQMMRDLSVFQNDVDRLSAREKDKRARNRAKKEGEPKEAELDLSYMTRRRNALAGITNACHALVLLLHQERLKHKYEKEIYLELWKSRSQSEDYNAEILLTLIRTMNQGTIATKVKEMESKVNEILETVKPETNAG